MEQAQVYAPIRLRAPFYSVKRLIARAICHPLVGRVISAVFRDRIPSHGSVIHTRDRAVVPAVKAALFWGIYESAELRFVREYLRTDLDVVELGSSLGVVTSQILRKVERNCRVLCVEANPRLLEILQKNIDENGKGKQATVVQAAIAEVSKSGQLLRLSTGADNTGSRISSTAATDKTLEVPAFALSAILRKQGIEGDFVLVSDIEGAEASFIEGDTHVLARCQQMIIELHETSWQGTAVTVERFRSLLEQRHGFHLRASRGPVCVFEKPSEAAPRRFSRSNLIRAVAKER